MKRIIVLCCGASLLATALAASAHHSFAVYDTETNVELAGTVGTLKFRNPHISMTLVQPGESGGQETVYSLEGGPANMLVRMGWSPTMIQPGDVIRVVASPRTDDPKALLLKAVILSDGTKITILN